MKYLLPILLIILSSIAHAQKSEPVDYTQLKPEHFTTLTHHQAFYDEHTKQNYRVINNERSKGVEIEVMKNGKSRYVKHGAFYNYYEGHKTRLKTYNYGKQDGVDESYNRKGVVKFLYHYKDGVKHGQHEQRNDKDEVVTEVTYENGKKEGLQTDYYNEKLLFTKNWKNGKLHGEHLQYNHKGKVVAKKTYNDGKKVGKTIFH